MTGIAAASDADKTLFGQAVAVIAREGKVSTSFIQRCLGIGYNKAEIAKIKDDQKRSLDEQAFLREYVKRAQGNAQNLTTVLEKIDAADKAFEAAAKAAAEAAKAAKK